MVDDIEIQEIYKLVATARKAQQNYEARGSQEIFDLACQAVGWALMQPENNSDLSKLAVSETGLGNVQDKIQKNHNKRSVGLMLMNNSLCSGSLINNTENDGTPYFLTAEHCTVGENTSTFSFLFG